MSDCSRRAWSVPAEHDREPGVLYAPNLTAYISEVDEIDVRGVRFAKVRECKNERKKFAQLYDYHFVCSKCGWSLPNDGNIGIRLAAEFVRWCPMCGAKVVDE